MNKESITYKQAISLIILTFTSSSLIWLPGINAGKDAWIVKIISILLVLPLTHIYNKSLLVFPKKDFYDISKIGFGKIIGTAVNIFFVWYFFHLGSLVLRSFGDIINAVSIPETPLVFPVICIVLVCILIAEYGIEIMGSWSETIVVFVICMILLTIILLTKDMHLNNLIPVLDKGIKPVLKEVPLAFAFPYGEIIIFTTVFTNIKGKAKGKLYTVGLLVSGFIGLIIYLVTLLVLGENLAQQVYFPGIAAVSRVDVANFVQRIEIIAPLTVIFGGVIKISLCILATSRGIAKLLNFKDYRFLVVPVAFMMFNVFILNFKSIFEIEKWLSKVFPIYSLPFQVVIPIMLYIIIVIKRKVNNV